MQRVTLDTTVLERWTSQLNREMIPGVHDKLTCIQEAMTYRMIDWLTVMGPTASRDEYWFRPRIALTADVIWDLVPANFDFSRVPYCFTRS